MNPAPILSTAPLEHPAMDYAFLRQEGIRWLERLAGAEWSDFNTHDPGITILEQLCYALTDLASRIEYALPDLLARAGRPGIERLHSPELMLTTHPVTLTDLRKLVLDVAGVRNAWVEPAADETVYVANYEQEPALWAKPSLPTPATAKALVLKGLYRVAVELTPGNDAAVVRRAVISHLHAQRGLCEDFSEVRILDVQTVRLQATIEIGRVEDPHALKLDICRRVAEHISPAVRRYSLAERLAAGQAMDEVFDGPLPEHGFIDSDELSRARRRTRLYTSDLIHAIMAVPGVKLVREIRIAAGPDFKDWSPRSLNLDAGKAPQFEMVSGDIKIERNGLPLAVHVDEEQLNAALERQQLSANAGALSVAALLAALQPPAGRDRHVGRYYSVQHQLPAVYGVGALGPPITVSPQRQAQVQQLKAYLMFFDQLLANSFAQLAHLPDLFAFDGETDDGKLGASYFFQPLDDSELGLDKLYLGEGDAWQARLQQWVEAPESTGVEAARQAALGRRQRFLNHLLACVGEQVTDHTLMGEPASATIRDRNEAAERLGRDKQRFLQAYPQLSRARGSAFNYLAPASEQNYSGLEQRLRLKLGLNSADERFYLVEHILLRPMAGDEGQNILLRPMAGDEGQTVPLLAKARLPDPYSLQLSFVFPTGSPESPRLKNLAFRRLVEHTIYEETPAHLIPTILWLNNREMRDFELVYHDWLEKRRSYWQAQLEVPA